MSGPICPCCGQPGGTCRGCGSEHVQYTGEGRCEECRDDEYAVIDRERERRLDERQGELL